MFVFKKRRLGHRNVKSVDKGCSEVRLPAEGGLHQEVLRGGPAAQEVPRLLIPEPFPVRGFVNMWNLDPADAKKILAQLEG